MQSTEPAAVKVRAQDWPGATLGLVKLPSPATIA
jgi:hypothetical protein